ncbi:MAG: RagB/SusD family nutrient uptake outer membrane protein [Odoribacter sp.]
MKKLYIFALTIAGLLCSCDDFLDVTPKGKLLPKTTQDYDEMMADPSHPSGAYPTVDLCGDNVIFNERALTSMVTSSTGKAYLWMEDFYTATEDDQVWNGCYNKIYTFNLVLERVDNSVDGTDSQKKRIKAEARFNRAYYYYFLHNCYAKAYDSQTAGADLSVPLRLTSDLEVKLSRATSQKVVDQLLEDIKNPEDLPEEAANEYRISRGGAYALSARIYLSLRDYDNALKNAALALEQNNTLLDYNTYSFKNPDGPYSGINNRPANYRISPERILYRGCNFSSLTMMYLMSEELLNSYDTLTDLRYQFNFTRLQRNGKPRTDKTPAYLQDLDYNISVPEMMLIKAECLARKNDRNCLTVLDDLRKCRIKQSAWTPLNVANDQLLETVLKERERELPFHGLRFFDMKRLSKEGIYTQTLERIYQGKSYKLSPNSNQYLFPISIKVRILNNSIVNNPR